VLHGKLKIKKPEGEIYTGKIEIYSDSIWKYKTLQAKNGEELEVRVRSFSENQMNIAVKDKEEEFFINFHWLNSQGTVTQTAHHWQGTFTKDPEDGINPLM